MTKDRDEDALQRLIRLIGEYQIGSMDLPALRTMISGDADLRAMIVNQAGGTVARGDKLIDFGSGQQMGDIHIRDVAGGHIFNVTIQVLAHQPADTAASLNADEIAHKRSLITQHRRMLQQLELQAAKFGIYTPPHITIEIDDLKRTIAGLRREIGEL